MANVTVKTRFNGDGELVTEIRKRFTKVNDYIQHPTADYFVDLMDQDLIQVYGRERIKEVVHDAFANHCDARPNSYGVPYLSFKLTACFGEFNKKYFDGKLPYKVHVLNQMDSHFRTAEIWREACVIQILAASEAIMVMRLLAEMARIASCDDGYGEAWEVEMARLDRAGAPVVMYANTLPPEVNARELIAEDFIKLATRPSRMVVMPETDDQTKPTVH